MSRFYSQIQREHATPHTQYLLCYPTTGTLQITAINMGTYTARTSHCHFWPPPTPWRWARGARSEFIQDCSFLSSKFSGDIRQPIQVRLRANLKNAVRPLIYFSSFTHRKNSHLFSCSVRWHSRNNPVLFSVSTPSRFVREKGDGLVSGVSREEAWCVP